MTEPLENAIEEIVNVLKDVTGLKNVPINPTESVSYDTFGVVYPDTGSIDIAPIGARKSLHNIAVDILTKRTDLARDFQRLKPLIDLVSKAMLDEVSIHGTAGTMFNGSIQTFESLSYSRTMGDYGGVPIIGYHFIMNNVKILVNT